jgi:hypothetical protein
MARQLTTTLVLSLAALVVLAPAVQGSRALRTASSNDSSALNLPDAASSSTFRSNNHTTSLSSLGFVRSNGSATLAPELMKALDTLQTHTPLMAAALACSEAVGVPYMAAGLSDALYNAVGAFKAYGFCGLPTLNEQTDRLAYMVRQSVSLHTRGILQADYKCDNMTGLPEECEPMYTALEGAINATALAYASNGLYCGGVDTDELQQVQLVTLPANWTAGNAIYSCTPREPLPKVTAEAANVATVVTTFVG